MEGSVELGISKTEYIERLVEGTIPSKLEKMVREFGDDIVAKIIKELNFCKQGFRAGKSSVKRT